MKHLIKLPSGEWINSAMLQRINISEHNGTFSVFPMIGHSDYGASGTSIGSFDTREDAQAVADALANEINRTNPNP